MPTGWTPKTKIKIYKKVIKEVCKEYEGASEFIGNKINELCFEREVSTEEVRFYIFLRRLETYSVLEYLFSCFLMLCTQFSYVHSLE